MRTAVRVALFTYEFPPRVYGGAGVHVYHLARELRKLVDLEIRTVHPAEDLEGVAVRRYYPSLLKGPADREGKALEVLSLNVNMVADPLEADVVHTHTWYTSFAGLLAQMQYGSRFVATVHSLEPLRPWKAEQLGRGYAVSRWVERVALEACDGVVAVSHGMADDVLAHTAVPKARIHVLPNGVDVTAFRRREDPALLDRLEVESPYLLFLGRLSRQKGIDVLLEAFRQMETPVDLVLVTGSPDTQDLVDDLRERLEGVRRVQWIHRTVTHEEAVALYSSCRALVTPSRYEPFGIINLEAMACERPVVATRVGGIPEVIVDGETGLLVPPENPGKLAQALDGLLADEAAAEAMGREGRKRVEAQFTWQEVARRTAALYEAIHKADASGSENS